MSAKQQRARISRGETTLAKVIPLAFVLIIFFNKLPYLPYLQGFALENLLTGVLFLGVAGAFAFEMAKTRIGGQSNFGTVLLAIFVIASLFMSLVFFFDLYDFGTNATVDVLIGVYFFAAIVLLAFQSAKELATGRRAKISKKEKSAV